MISFRRSSSQCTGPCTSHQIHNITSNAPLAWKCPVMFADIRLWPSTDFVYMNDPFLISDNDSVKLIEGVLLWNKLSACLKSTEFISFEKIVGNPNVDFADLTYRPYNCRMVTIQRFAHLSCCKAWISLYQFTVAACLHPKLKAVQSVVGPSLRVVQPWI